MGKTGGPDLSYTQNRELSWLRFNARVLEEAEDSSVPLFDRFRFLSIFSENLDEFLMVRAGRLLDRRARGERTRDQKSGLTPGERLGLILAELPALSAGRDEVFRKLEAELAQRGILRVSAAALSAAERETAGKWFHSAWLPSLTPVEIGRRHPFPELQSGTPGLAALLGGGGRLRLGVMPVPKRLPSLFVLSKQPFRFVLAEDLLTLFADQLFTGRTVLDRCLFSVLRNADLCLEGRGENYARELRGLLAQRELLPPVCLKLSGAGDGALRTFLLRESGLEDGSFLSFQSPLSLSWHTQLAAHLERGAARTMAAPRRRPAVPGWAGRGERVLSQVLKKDRLLSYPYESFEPFLRLLSEAAEDEAVLSIRMTVYRLAERSRVAAMLCKAAARGCEVTVLIELQARFDERSNADWAEQLRKAGCTVIYGLEGLKIHAKILLITRREAGGTATITQIGTGNYNERTASQYTDLSLFTADPAIGADAARFFRNMSLSRPNGTYDKLIVSPCSLQNRLFKEIDEEIRKAKSGRGGHIILKVNSLSERGVIDRLSEASRAGVQVELIVRGICCLLPGIPGKTENVTVTSIVGRFLEHSRIYCFGDGAERKLFLSSADLMDRNLFHRVEIACPVEDPALKKRLSSLLGLMLRDNVKARRLSPDGRYLPVPSDPAAPRADCQRMLAEDAALRRKPERRKAAGRPRPAAKQNRRFPPPGP